MIPERQMHDFKPQVEQWPVGRLLPYAANARTHSDAQVAQIAGSIAEFGFNVPCLVDERGVLIAGHGRLLAATKLGLESVPVIRLAQRRRRWRGGTGRARSDRCRLRSLAGGRALPGTIPRRRRIPRPRSRRKKRLRARAAWHHGGGLDYCAGCADMGPACATGAAGPDGAFCPYVGHAPATVEG